MTELDVLKRRILQLEECYAHQEHTLQQLNDVILQLQSESERWRMRYERRVEQLEQQQHDSSLPDDPDEKPPHY